MSLCGVVLERAYLCRGPFRRGTLAGPSWLHGSSAPSVKLQRAGAKGRRGGFTGCNDSFCLCEAVQVGELRRDVCDLLGGLFFGAETHCAWSACGVVVLWCCASEPRTRSCVYCRLVFLERRED